MSLEPLGLNEWRDLIHQTAQDKGWWDQDRTFGDVIALCHSELSEALEEFRKGKDVGDVYSTFDKPNKPEGVPVELVDVIIRILDYCGKVGIDVEDVMYQKFTYNAGRPYRHGGKQL